MGYIPKLQEQYEKEIRSALKQELGIKNDMQIPRVDKVVINIGVGEASQDSKLINGVVEELGLISGQKPVITKAKKSIAGFKLREGQAIGAKVTLRKQRMYEFIDRLVNIALPRTRDFRGISHKSFDKKGNYSLGIREQLIFPEIDYDKVQNVRGMDITIVTTAETDEHAKALLTHLNFPFAK
jgi:large subunit ribosomal protein L5